MESETWMHKFYAQGLIVLNTISEASSGSRRSCGFADEVMQSDLTDDCEAISTMNVNQKCCLQLLRRLLYRAVSALTQQKYWVRSILVEAADSAGMHNAVSLDFIITQLGEASFSDVQTDFAANGIAAADHSIKPESPEDATDQRQSAAKTSQKRKSRTGNRKTTAQPKKRRRQSEETASVDNAENANGRESGLNRKEEDLNWYRKPLNELADSSDNELVDSVNYSRPKRKARGRGKLFSDRLPEHPDSPHLDEEDDEVEQSEVKKRQRRSARPDELATDDDDDDDDYNVDDDEEEDDDDYQGEEEGGDHDFEFQANNSLDTSRTLPEAQPLVGQPKSRTKATRDHCLVLSRPICLMCSAVFASFSDCVEHWRQCHITNFTVMPRITCSHCPQKFVLPITSLRNDTHVEARVARWFDHAVRVHGFECPSTLVEQFTCGDKGCKFTGFTPAALRMHQRKYKHARCGSWSLIFHEFRCFLCPDAAMFSSKNTLREHVVECHVDADDEGALPALVCPDCGLKRPMIRQKDLGNNPESVLSGRFFENFTFFLRHLVSKHNWSVPPYIQSHPCEEPECGFVGVTLNHLETHATTHEARGSGSQVPCEKCGKLFSQKYLHKHLQICQLPFADRSIGLCQHCGTRFSSHHDLRYHVRKDHGINNKDFLCSECTFSCRQKHTLEQHMFRQHGVNIAQRKVFSCEQCDFQTISRKALVTHRETAHSDVKAIPCVVCNKTYRSQLHLKMHMITHGERRYACQTCEFRATTRKSLNKHIRSHQRREQRPFVCDNAPCQYCALDEVGLKKHQRRCRYRQRRRRPPKEGTKKGKAAVRKLDTQQQHSQQSSMGSLPHEASNNPLMLAVHTPNKGIDMWAA